MPLTKFYWQDLRIVWVEPKQEHVSVCAAWFDSKFNAYFVGWTSNINFESFSILDVVILGDFVQNVWQKSI